LHGLLRTGDGLFHGGQLRLGLGQSRRVDRAGGVSLLQLLADLPQPRPCLLQATLFGRLGMGWRDGSEQKGGDHRDRCDPRAGQ
jgi:hypothetical protein